MNAQEIQTAVDALLADMLARGLRSPQCTAFISAREFPSIYLHWDEDGISYGRTEIGRGDDIAEALENAGEILQAIPTKEDRDRAEFTRLLANAIDKGRAIGIELEFVNPLVETMKRLSENALTHAAA